MTELRSCIFQGYITESNQSDNAGQKRHKKQGAFISKHLPSLMKKGCDSLNTLYSINI